MDTLKWLLLCPVRLVVEFVDQIAAAIVRPAAGTHFWKEAYSKRKHALTPYLALAGLVAAVTAVVVVKRRRA